MKNKAVAWLRLNVREDPYPDGWLMVLLAFIASIYALYPFPHEPFFNLLTHRWFIYSLSVVFTMVDTQVLLINWISIWLEKKYDWDEQLWLRIVWQLLMGWSLPVVASMLVGWFAFQYINADTRSIRYAYNVFVFKNTMDSAAILNGIYLIFSFYYHYQRKSEKAAAEKSPQVPYAGYLHLRISEEKEETRVRVSDISYIYRTEKGLLVLRRHDGSSVICWDSLDDLQRLLDPARYCRISRPFIITREAIDKMRKHPDRGMLIELKPPSDEPAKVSRDNVKKVRAWIRNDVPSQAGE